MVARLDRGTLGSEIRQTAPFPSLGTEVYLTLVRTTDRVTNSASQTLRKEKLTLQQYNVLRILRGSKKDGLLVHEVADRMVSRAPNITRLVDKLERKKLVVRSRSEQDRRTVRLRLTPSGDALVERLSEKVASESERAMHGLDSKELEQLRALLDKLRHGTREEAGCDPVSG